MAAINTSWLIGSVTLQSSATIIVNGNNHSVAAGTYYLRDADNDLSLIRQIQNAIAAEVPGTTVHIGRDRKLRIVSGGASLTLTIASALQAVTGLPASPTAGTTVTASNISTLLWSPSWPERPTGHPVGTAGYRTYDRVVSSSPTGETVNVNWHHYQTTTKLSWSAVPQSRTWTSDELGGEFVSFYQNVLIPGYRFKLYSGVSEDASVTTTVSWPTAMGPYICHVIAPDWYQRFSEASDAIGANIELEAVMTGEIG